MKQYLQNLEMSYEQLTVTGLFVVGLIFFFTQNLKESNINDVEFTLSKLE